MSLGGYVVRRLLQMVPIVLGVTVLVFFLIHLVPGDPAQTILGTRATPQKVALLHHDAPAPDVVRLLGDPHGGLVAADFTSAGRAGLRTLPSWIRSEVTAGIMCQRESLAQAVFEGLFTHEA